MTEIIRPLGVQELLNKAEAAGLAVAQLGVTSAEVRLTPIGAKVAMFFWVGFPAVHPRAYLYVDGLAYAAAYSHVARKFDELGEARQKEDNV